MRQIVDNAIRHFKVNVIESMSIEEVSRLLKNLFLRCRSRIAPPCSKMATWEDSPKQENEFQDAE